MVNTFFLTFFDSGMWTTFIAKEKSTS